MIEKASFHIMDPCCGEQMGKTLTATEASMTLSSNRSFQSSFDIGAYRPHVSRTIVRNEAAYAQHLDNVHRSAALSVPCLVSQ